MRVLPSSVKGRMVFAVSIAAYVAVNIAVESLISWWPEDALGFGVLAIIFVSSQSRAYSRCSIWAAPIARSTLRKSTAVVGAEPSTPAVGYTFLTQSSAVLAQLTKALDEQLGAPLPPDGSAAMWSSSQKLSEVVRREVGRAKCLVTRVWVSPDGSCAYLFVESRRRHSCVLVAIGAAASSAARTFVAASGG